MNYIKETTDFSISNTAVALGKFDALHLGHKLLIDKLIGLKKEGLNSCIFTFDLSPLAVLESTDNQEKVLNQVLLSKEERVAEATKFGIDYFIEYPFTKEFSMLQPESFVKEILVDKLDVKYIVVGNDFKFGNNRIGDVNFLSKLGVKYGFEVIVFDKLIIDNEVVSSSLIRSLIKEGKVSRASNLLGRNFALSGEVINGKQLGRTIGFPTINIAPEVGKVIPLKGVYKTKVIIDNDFFQGVTNVGSNPTVIDTKNIKIETHIINFDKMIYGKNVKILFEDFIREEKKFNSIDELKEQLIIDVQLSK